MKEEKLVGMGNKKVPLLLVVSMLLVTIFFNFFWLKSTDIVYPTYSITIGLESYRRIKEGMSLLFSHLKSLEYYPPFYMLSIMFGFLIFGPSKFVPFWVNVFYLAILAYSLYKVGIKIKGSYTGALASFIILSLPGVLVLWRINIMEIALTSWVGLTLYLFISTECFEKRLHSVLLGIVLGIGLLIKWTYSAYVFGAFFLYFQLIFWRSRGPNLNLELSLRKRSSNFILCMLLAFLISGPWYLRFLDLSYFFSSLQNDPTALPLPKKMFFYLKALKENLLLPGYFFLFLFTFIIFPLMRRREMIPYLFLFPFLTGLLIFSFLAHIETRYILPLLPYVAVIISGAIASIGWRAIKVILTLVVIASGVYSYGYSLKAFPTSGGDLKRTSFSDLKEGAGTFEKMLECISSRFSSDKSRSINIATSPFNDLNNIDALAETLVYRLGLRKLRGKNMNINLIGFDALEFRSFPYKIQEINFLIVTEDVLTSEKSIFEKQRQALRNFRINFVPEYQEILQDDPSYRKLILKNFLPIGKFPSVLGSDIILFENVSLRER